MFVLAIVWGKAEFNGKIYLYNCYIYLFVNIINLMRIKRQPTNRAFDNL